MVDHSASHVTLGGMSHEEFLRDYWQKRPLLIRQAAPGFVPHLTAAELAGLACLPDVDARLVLQDHRRKPWTLKGGPFRKADFKALPKSRWTLLVQDIDKIIPEVAELLDHFSFIPNWRIDDIMISYATAGGNVGPHIDNYDVFLLQAQGERRWQINDRHVAPADEKFLPATDLRILKSFKATATWVLQPGDMLYLPPRLAHHGVAVGTCMTYSIGFRAPTHVEILENLIADMGATLDPEARYTDPDLELQHEPGALTAAAIRRLQPLMAALPRSEAELAQWFGCYVTRPRHRFRPAPVKRRFTAAAVRKRLKAGDAWHRDESSKLSYHAATTTGALHLFVNGEAIVLPPALTDFAALVSRQSSYRGDAARRYLGDDQAMDFLTRLFNAGVFYFPS